MDKHTKKTPSLFRYPVLVAFGLFFIGLFVLDMATPDRAYSELENTTLTQRPRLPHKLAFLLHIKKIIFITPVHSLY